jgi:hypothetical protein
LGNITKKFKEAVAIREREKRKRVYLIYRKFGIFTVRKKVRATS